uniref:Signal recognition particle 14 kDa protein n=1 Tax=Cyprinus carpio TaxID=7962 RepID=A0A8C2I228_CYPCA
VIIFHNFFLTELTRLFQKCRTTGSVVITLKKCMTKPVSTKEVIKFQMAYSNLLRAHMDGLKKKDKKSKSKKTKATQ